MPSTESLTKRFAAKGARLFCSTRRSRSSTSMPQQTARVRHPLLRALDPETGQTGAWTVAIVRAILRNPKYLGRQVWGRRHGRPTPHAQWVRSDSWVHPPVIDPDTFAVAQRAPGTPARRDKTGPSTDPSARTAA